MAACDLRLAGNWHIVVIFQFFFRQARLLVIYLTLQHGYL